MDEFEWIDDTDGRITRQQIDGVETGFALDVDEVFEVPAHEVLEPRHGADGDMRGVVGVFGRDDALAQAGGGEVFHFTGHLQQRFGAEGIVKKIAHVPGGVLDFALVAKLRNLEMSFLRGEAELRGEGRDGLEPVRRRVNPKAGSFG